MMKENNNKNMTKKSHILMKTYDGRKGKRLSHEIVGKMRFFGFYIGNETILSSTDWGVHYDITIISKIPEALGNIFTLELFRAYDSKGKYNKTSDVIGIKKSSTQLIGEYIQSLNDNTEFQISFKNIKSKNKNNWRDVIARFFIDLGHNNLQTLPLKEYSGDYAYIFISEGSYLETLTALFCNILRMDKDFNVINEDWARYRASQYIYLINDSSNSYKIIPPFKEWEMKLWM